MLKILKKVLLKIFIFLVIFVVFFAVSEFFFRLFRGKQLYLNISIGNQNKQSPYLFNPKINHQLKSPQNEFDDTFATINNYGFRGKDINLRKEPEVTRIFAVGDSFTYGIGASDNETIPYLIEEKLKNQGFDVEVINAGLGHSSPILHYMNLRNIHLKFKPDVVLLLFDCSDLRDDWYFERHMVYDKNGKMLYTDTTFIDGKRDWWTVLVKNSEFCHYINNKIVRTIEKMKILGFKGYIKAKMEGKRSKAAIANLKNNDPNFDSIAYDQYIFIRGPQKLPQIKKHWKRTEKYLLMVRDILKEDGIDLVLVSYPYGIHVGPNQWGDGRTYWGFDSGKTYDGHYAFDLLKNFAQQNNIPYIETYDNFLAEADKNKDKALFFNFDGHLNPDGNEIVADTIAINKDFKALLNRKISEKK